MSKLLLDEVRVLNICPRCSNSDRLTGYVAGEQQILLIECYPAFASVLVTGTI